MKNLLSVLLLALTLSGCGSILSSMNVGSIEDEPGERTFAQLIEDDAIETKAMVNIHAANESYHDAHLVAVSYNGFVLLAGQVANEDMKAEATKVVRKVAGVRRIYNELEIGPPTSAGTRTKDAWITTKIKSKLLGTEEIASGRVKVVTENGVVYLMGVVTKKEAELISEKAATTSSVMRVVKVFEVLD